MLLSLLCFGMLCLTLQLLSMFDSYVHDSCRAPVDKFDLSMQ